MAGDGSAGGAVSSIGSFLRSAMTLTSGSWDRERRSRQTRLDGLLHRHAPVVR